MMAAPSSLNEFIEVCQKSGLFSNEHLAELSRLPGQSPSTIAKQLLRQGKLTKFQASQLLAGKHRGLVFDQLKVLDRIGSGGMGMVFLCEHQNLKKQVAVKMLPPELSKDAGTLERFIQEARAAATLDHPNIVGVFDMRQNNGIHYIVMEYIDGHDLQHMINKYGPIHYERAVGYLVQAALGLQHAHDKHIVHRDIKPGNLLVDKAGQLKILDLGLALYNRENVPALTEKFDKGAILGTADFMAPEQIVNSSEVDHRADIYSLGATLYTIINGKPPFSGNSSQKLIGHQLHQATSLSKIRTEVPKGLSKVVERMMEKDPNQRFQTMSEVIDALIPWAPTETVENLGPKTKISQRHRQPMQAKNSKRPTKLLLFGLLAIIAVSAIGAAIYFSGGKENKPVAQDTDKKPQPYPDNNQPVNPLAKTDTLVKKSIFAAKFAETPSFKMDFEAGKVSGQVGQIIPGWNAYVWSPDSKGSVGIEEFAGSRALALRTNSGTASAEIMTSHFNGSNFVPGRLYRAEVCYATTGDKPLTLEFRFDEQQKDHPYQKNCPGTNGTYATQQFDFKAPNHKNVNLYLSARNAITPDHAYVKSIELFELSTTSEPVLPSGYLFQWSPDSFKGIDSKISNRTAEHLKPFPKGFSAQCWQADGTGTIKYNDTDRALELRNTVGKSLMLLGPEVELSPGTEYQIEIDYRTTKSARAILRVKEGESGARDAQPLPSSDDWRSITLNEMMPLDSRPKLLLEIHQVTESPEACLAIRSLNLRIKPAAKSPGQTLYRASFERVKKFQYPTTSGQLIGNTPETSIYEGWVANCWSKDDNGSVSGLDYRNRRCIAIENGATSNKQSIQLYTSNTKTTPVIGKHYRVRVTYALDGSTNNSSMLIRHGLQNEKQVLRLLLPPTLGEWKTIERDFQAQETIPFGLFIQHGRTNSQGSIMIQSVEILSID